MFDIMFALKKETIGTSLAEGSSASRKAELIHLYVLPCHSYNTKKRLKHRLESFTRNIFAH
jgi:hypothetical protein